MSEQRKLEKWTISAKIKKDNPYRVLRVILANQIAEKPVSVHCHKQTYNIA